ncbi:alpha-N-arabinofuranosidase [Cellulomonas chitinilytica]|uniref:Alpha-N-arabinofuranosidase n=1 Tax=Cellulomonas chitinilytica TaxID=398759 RepID=A0A919P2K4_9CELL|nr:RICIN domain-containing protein [Cellulomonas chitinilytica]GIG22152.1 alpha-N-arabinofuranosidase [Cellulomonas chitinilytica]
MRIRTITGTARSLWAATAAGVALAAGIVGLTALPASAASVDTGAYYVLVNRQSGKAMEVANWSTADGGVIQQWTRNDGNWQQWKFVDSGSGWYRLQNRHSGKVLDLWGWSTADGGEFRQYTDSNGWNQQFKLVDSEGGRVRLVNRHSGKLVTVTDRSTADGATVTQLTDNNQYNQQWELVKLGSSPEPTSNPTSAPSTGLVGWASQNGGTTGGGSASVTTVTSASALTSAASGTTAKVVRVSGTISCSGMLTIGSNKTIEGASGSKIVGCGLNVKSAKNVILRNLTFDGWDDDAINVETSTNVWIDHNTFGTGYDGSADIKRASDYVTVSWNRFNGQNKNSLVGHSDDNGSQDRGHLRVTYHHNWFNGTTQRNPRVRFGNPVHVYNNLYSSVKSYGVASTEEAGVLVEGNYFENTPDTYHLGEGSSSAGSLVARNNTFVGSTAGQTGGSVASIPYSYSLDSSSQVKSIVSAGAGAR